MSITSPTFGFVIGLALSAPLISALFRALKKRWKLFPAALVAGLAGILVTYLCGAVYGYFVMTLVLSQGSHAVVHPVELVPDLPAV